MVDADSIYLNANVLTLDESNPRARAFAVIGGKFDAVGTDEQVRAQRSAHTDLNDLHGQTVIPGLIDAHNHMLSTGKILRALPLFGARSLVDVQRKLRARAAGTPKGEWIVGRGWDESLLAESRAPTRHDLDVAAPDHPVVLHRVWNKLVCNSLALKRAGISRQTVYPAPGAEPSALYAGQIVRDMHGEPTGLFTDRAKQLIERAIPPPSDAELDAS